MGVRHRVAAGIHRHRALCQANSVRRGDATSSAVRYDVRHNDPLSSIGRGSADGTGYGNRHLLDAAEHTDPDALPRLRPDP